MTMALILAAALAVGAVAGRWWALSLPFVAGALVASAILLTGHNLADTPIPFLIVTATIAVAAGVLLRSRSLKKSVL